MEPFVNQSWEAFVELLGNTKFYGLYLNGDLADGSARRGYGRDVWTNEPEEQAECAIEVINYIKKHHLVKGAPIIGARGTAYHAVMGGVDVENLVAKETDMDLKYEQYVDMDGITINFKHHIGGRNKPHTQGTQLPETKLHNLYLADIEMAPRADVFMRGHLHKYRVFSDPTYTAMLLPCLQGPYTDFGGRVCEGAVNMGFMKVWEEEGRFMHLFKEIRWHGQKKTVISG
jgi:hypothetical protein